jgi:hypothetical protein
MSIFIKTEISNGTLCEDARSAARGLVSRSNAQIRALAGSYSTKCRNLSRI